VVKVLVTGGTGLLGRSVVGRLLAAGHEVRVLSRNPSGAPAGLGGADVCRGDLRDPASLPAALSTVEVVVHCATDSRSATDVDIAGTATLARAAAAAGVGHLVHVSIVGVDRVPIRFYRAKREAETTIEEQSIPWTIQRATQFHPFVDGMLARSARLPFIACPRGLRFQPIAVQDVADRLVQHVASGPSGRAPDLGGPQVLSQKELAATWLRARGQRRLLVPVPLPGKLGRAFGDGANLCPEHASGGVSWSDYLDARYGGGQLAGTTATTGQEK
jgi:uncharacterized protein YbjT (DUF2867 family)